MDQVQVRVLSVQVQVQQKRKVKSGLEYHKCAKNTYYLRQVNEVTADTVFYDVFLCVHVSGTVWTSVKNFQKVGVVRSHDP